MKDIKNFFFKNRGYTPIPIALILLFLSDLKSSILLPGIILIITGELIRINGVRFAGGLTRTRKVGAKRLCTSGPFAYVRNPLYLGNIIIYSGIVLFAGGQYIWIKLLVTIVFFIIQYSLIVSLEEETLLEIFRSEYQLYKKSVPRIFPRIFPWQGGNETTPLKWFPTIKTEKRTLQILFVFIVLIILRTTLST